VQSEEKHNVHIEKVLDAAEEGSCWGWIVQIVGAYSSKHRCTGEVASDEMA
jgi:hypothetical protein